MNLRNKKTGKIHTIYFNLDGGRDYKSLAELNAEWCDVEPVRTWEEGVKTKKLKCGLEIALEDYYEIYENGDKKTEFTWDEAMEIEEKTGGKWRVPSMLEWMQICIEISTEGSDSVQDFDRDGIVKMLKLLNLAGSYGYYWSSTVRDSIRARFLYFDSDHVNLEISSCRYNSYSIRCIKGDTRSVEVLDE